MNARDTIREFVGRELRRRNRGKDVTFSDQESLLLSSKVDSLFFIDLIVFLEKEFSFPVNQAEVEKEDLDTIDKMVQLIETNKP